MIKVQLRPNEPLEAALRRFKRQCNYAGVFRLSKKYAYYEKESDRKRREERERIRNIQRAQRRMDAKVKPRAPRKSRGRPGRPPRESGETVSVLETSTAR
jgi:small subunit ribosomal protein S21